MPLWRNPFDETLSEEDWKLFSPPLLFQVRSRINSKAHGKPMFGSVVLVYPLSFRNDRMIFAREFWIRWARLPTRCLTTCLCESLDSINLSMT
jgi:hypothetical protein